MHQLEFVGLDPFSQGDLETFSKSFSGRRHAISDQDEKGTSLIDGSLTKQIDGGNTFFLQNVKT